MVHRLVPWIFLISGVVASIVWIAGLIRRNAAHQVLEHTLDSFNRPGAKGDIDRKHCEETRREPKA